MNDRRLDVLRAIVSQYVHTREPVGSKAIAQSQDLGVSSATIRNDMAVLEEAGLIYQPHTSAGRVPTDKGYRVFVDQLATLKPMSAPERQAVEKFLARAEDLDDVVMATVRLLAQVTRQVALIEYPVNARSTLSRIEFVDLSDSRLLIVVITEQGKVFERLREMPQDLAQEDLLTLRSVLNAAYQGKDAGEVRAHYEAMAECLPPALSGCAGDISEIIATSTSPSVLKTDTMLSLRPPSFQELTLPGGTQPTWESSGPPAWTTPRQCPRSTPWPRICPST